MPGLRLNRRHVPTALGLLAAATLAWYLLYSQFLVREMRHESEVHSRIVVRILTGLNDPSPEAPTRTLLELSGELQDLDFPIILADDEGIPSAVVHVPFAFDAADSASVVRALAYARDLARHNRPIVAPGLGTIYYGDSLTIRRLRWIPWLQVSAMVCLLLAAGWMVRHNQRTERERIWAAMARESAHQMATPLSSLAGWVEILRLPEEEREDMATLPAVAGEMEADLDRLEKVARRFEWIGRPVQKEAVEVRPMLRVLERYVRVRLPQLRRSVELTVDVPEGVPPVLGNAILLEWALENLIKNALDALAGSGGKIEIDVEAPSERRVEIRVSDNGPGVAPAVRNTLFDPGVSTKKGGWGVGLSLARRIVEDVHEGRLALAPTERGATFVLTLPAAPVSEADDKRHLLRPTLPRLRAWSSQPSAHDGKSGGAGNAATASGDAAKGGTGDADGAPGDGIRIVRADADHVARDADYAAGGDVDRISRADADRADADRADAERAGDGGAE